VAHGLGLSALSYLYVLAGVVCVLSLALFFATFTNSSLTAAIGALVVVIVMHPIRLASPALRKVEVGSTGLDDV
jgi:hypothetical protein